MFLEQTLIRASASNFLSKMGGFGVEVDEGNRRSRCVVAVLRTSWHLGVILPTEHGSVGSRHLHYLLYMYHAVSQVRYHWGMGRGARTRQLHSTPKNSRRNDAHSKISMLC